MWLLDVKLAERKNDYQCFFLCPISWIVEWWKCSHKRQVITSQLSKGKNTFELKSSYFSPTVASWLLSGINQGKNLLRFFIWKFNETYFSILSPLLAKILQQSLNQPLPRYLSATYFKSEYAKSKYHFHYLTPHQTKLFFIITPLTVVTTHPYVHYTHTASGIFNPKGGQRTIRSNTRIVDLVAIVEKLTVYLRLANIIRYWLSIACCDRKTLTKDWWST